MIGIGIGIGIGSDLVVVENLCVCMFSMTTVDKICWGLSNKYFSISSLMSFFNVAKIQ